MQWGQAMTDQDAIDATSPYHLMQDVINLDPVCNTMDDCMAALRQHSANGNERAAYELERLQDRRKYNNAKKWLRVQQTRLLTKQAGEEIKRHLNALHLRHEYNDVMPTHRRLKIGEDAAHAVSSLPLWAIAVKHGVQITLDTVNHRETLHHMTVRHGMHDYCLRITPGEPDVYTNI